jgi:uncharacterized protein (DUF58 family)
LLDPAFVGELEALQRRLTIRARSGAHGDHRARRRGGSAEFHEHRGYSPGDDPRRIDWAALARSDTAVVKVFKSEEDVVARLLLDTSRSLDHGEPRKLWMAQRIAAALGYMALARGERAQLVLAESGSIRPFAPLRGRARLLTLLAQLAAASADGTTHLARSIDKLVRQSSRAGLLVVLSDFLDPGPVLRALGRARAAGHDVALVQVLAPEELDPPNQGDCALEDLEEKSELAVTMDAGAIEAYLDALDDLCRGLAAFARTRGASYLRVASNDALDEAVRRLTARSID